MNEVSVTRIGEGGTIPFTPGLAAGPVSGLRSGDARPLGVSGASGEALTTRTAFPNLASEGESGVAM